MVSQLGLYMYLFEGANFVFLTQTAKLIPSKNSDLRVIDGPTCSYRYAHCMVLFL